MTKEICEDAIEGKQTEMAKELATEARQSGYLHRVKPSAKEDGIDKSTDPAACRSIGRARVQRRENDQSADEQGEDCKHIPSRHSGILRQLVLLGNSPKLRSDEVMSFDFVGHAGAWALAKRL